MKNLIRNKTKILLCLIATILLIFGASILFMGCEKEKDIKVSVGANGQVTGYKENGSKFYEAKPDIWYTFDGWYDGSKLYSTNTCVKVTERSPKSLEARFTSTGLLGFDRILNGLYNSVLSGTQEVGENLNISADLKFSSQGSQEKELNIGGFIDFENESSQVYFLSDENSLIYHLDELGGKLCVGLNGNKVAYKDAGIITNILTKPNELGESWNSQSLLSESAYYQFNQYFGINNASGFVENVKIEKSSNTIELSLNKIFTMMKNLYSTFEEGSLYKNLADIFVGSYLESAIPSLSMKIKADYSEMEELFKIEMDFSLSDDYKLCLGEREVIIPKSNYHLSIQNIRFEYSAEKNSISKEIISSYPLDNKNMINMRVLGGMNFLDGNNLVDAYDIEINSDINPMALLSFKKDSQGYDKIEWGNLGLFSLKIELKEESDPLISIETDKRHNGGSTYLSVLIDTYNFGAKMFVYADLYNPTSLLTTSYFINATYDIPSLLDFKSGAKTYSNESSFNPISLIEMVVKFVTNFDKIDIGEIVYNAIDNALNGFGISSESLSYKNGEVKLKLTEIRNYLRQIEKENGLIFLGKPVKLDKHLFGEDGSGDEGENTNKIDTLSISFVNIEKGCVNKGDNFYLDRNGNEINGVSDKYSTILAIDDLELENIILEVGQSIKATSVKLADGNICENYISNKGKIEELILEILDLKTLELNENGNKIRLVLQIRDKQKLSQINYSFGDVVNNVFSLPYGLYVFDVIMPVA